MLTLLKTLLVATFTTVVLMGCGVLTVEFGESDNSKPYVPQGILVTRTPTPSPVATAPVVIELRPTPFGVPSGTIILGGPQLGPTMVVRDTGISFEPTGTGSSCFIEVPDVPIQTLSELLTSVDDGIVEDRLKDFAKDYPTRRVSPEDEDYKTYVEFTALAVRIMGGTASDQQEVREFINECSEEGR